MELVRNGTEKIIQYRKVVLIFMGIICLCFWKMESPINQETNYMDCFLFSICLFCIIYLLKIKGRLINMVCEYNFEIYLVHHRIFIVFLPLLYHNGENTIQLLFLFLFLVGFIILFSEKLHFIICKNCHIYSNL